MHIARKFFGIVGDIVHRTNFATHIDRLRHGHRCGKHIVHIVGECAFREQSHLRRNHRAFVNHGQTSGGVLHKIEVVGSGCGVESFGGKQLVFIHEREFLLIIDISTLEVKTWQISRLSLFALVACLLNFDLLLQNFLIVGNSHAAT